MSTTEPKDDPQVGELRFVRNSKALDKSVDNCNAQCECADPGTGADDCHCEDNLKS